MSKKIKKKIGSEPGTLLYTGEKDLTEDIPVIHYTYNSETFQKNSFIFKDEFSIQIHPSFVNWLDIGGIHNIELIKKIGSSFDIDSLILEDLLSNSQRPKIYVRDKFIFITLRMISHFRTADKYEYEQVSFILFSNLLITFREHPSDIFDSIKARIEQGVGKLVNKREGYLIYSLIDRIVDEYFLIIDDLEQTIEDLEDEITTNPKNITFEQILDLKKEILKLKKAVVPLKEFSYKFRGPDIEEYLGENLDIYLKDLQDHIIVVIEATESLFARGNELLQLYLSTINNVMNEVMKLLTMISTIFIPLSFLASLYGMNFEFMPELKMKYAYFIVLFFMILIFFSAIYFFKKKKWW